MFTSYQNDTCVERLDIGPDTCCDVAHLRWGVPKPLRCRKIACDALRSKFQHVGKFAPDIQISQLFIV